MWGVVRQPLGLALDPVPLDRILDVLNVPLLPPAPALPFESLPAIHDLNTRFNPSLVANSKERFPRTLSRKQKFNKTQNERTQAGRAVVPLDLQDLKAKVRP